MTTFRLVAAACLLLPFAAFAQLAGDPVAGRAAFQPCMSCHQVGPTARAGFGPQLNGIVGRPAGSTDYAYSAALKNAGIVWTEPLLKAFILDAQRTVPGTKMRFSSFGYSDRKVTDLVAYLRGLPAVKP